MFGARSMHRQLTVMAAPAWRSAQGNPLTKLLALALRDAGCVVLDLTRPNAIRCRADILHVHWPQSRAGGRFFRALRRSFEFLFAILLQKVRGAKLVWTAHNVYAHDQKNPSLERMLMFIVTRLLNGVIFLSRTSRSEVEDLWPHLKNVPSTVIPHPLYGNTYHSVLSQDDARAKFGIGSGSKVVAFVGDIKPYKGLDILLDAVAQIPPGTCTLLVAGAFASDERYRQTILNSIEDIRSHGGNIVLIEKRLNDAEFVEAIRCADLVALPYKKISNSGLAIVIIEQGIRILTTDTPLFREMAAELGQEWVWVASSGLTASIITEALNASISDSGRVNWEEFCSSRSMNSVAARNLDFYAQLLDRSAPELWPEESNC